MEYPSIGATSSAVNIFGLRLLETRSLPISLSTGTDQEQTLSRSRAPLDYTRNTARRLESLDSPFTSTMEQAQAGCGLQDVLATHALPNGHVNGANGFTPEKEITYNPARQHASSKKSRTSRANGGVEDIALCASPAGFLARKQKDKHPRRRALAVCSARPWSTISWAFPSI